MANNDVLTAAGDGMTTTLFLVAVVVVTALFFDFTNGFHDSANAMATSVATGALRPRTAVLIAAVLNVVGAFLSTEVAKTISGGIVNDAFVTPTMIFAGLVAAILWNLTTWLFGLPSSSSRAPALAAGGRRKTARVRGVAPAGTDDIGPIVITPSPTPPANTHSTAADSPS